MTVSREERRIRAGLPVIRLAQAYVPLPIAHWALGRAVARAALPQGVAREPVSAGGVACEWLIPRGSSPDRVLLYLHGGGFVYGPTPQHLGMVADLAGKLGARGLMVDYRLAPQHPYPAALDDCAAAYRWLMVQGILAKNIAIAGDSAGGNLAITTLMRLRDEGDLLPAAAACLSPVADLTGGRPVRPGFRDPLLHPRAVRFYNTAYAGSADPRDPLISPIFGDWRGLPPLLIHAGEDELLCEDAARCAELARAAGVEVRLEIYPRMWHVWQIFPELPQTAQSLDDIAGFLGERLDPGSPR